MYFKFCLTRKSLLAYPYFFEFFLLNGHLFQIECRQCWKNKVQTCWKCKCIFSYYWIRLLNLPAAYPEIQYFLKTCHFTWNIEIMLLYFYSQQESNINESTLGLWKLEKCIISWFDASWLLLFQGKRCPKMVSRRVKSGMCLAHRGGDVKQGSNDFLKF